MMQDRSVGSSTNVLYRRLVSTAVLEESVAWGNCTMSRCSCPKNFGFNCVGVVTKLFVLSKCV